METAAIGPFNLISLRTRLISHLARCGPSAGRRNSRISRVFLKVQLNLLVTDRRLGRYFDDSLTSVIIMRAVAIGIERYFLVGVRPRPGNLLGEDKDAAIPARSADARHDFIDLAEIGQATSTNLHRCGVSAVGRRWVASGANVPDHHRRSQFCDRGT